MATLIRDLLDLPQTVSKGDFVQSLARSLANPDDTVDTYAVTGALVQNFCDSLRVVVGALSSGQSQPVFLHGSFGSGKSHFMAMLHLMLAGHPAPWSRPDLHPVRATYEPIKGKTLLQLHFHMLGSRSIEDAVFAGYVAHVRAQHPDADLPALFRDQEVFDNARHLRETMGDAPFFAALNQGKRAVAGLGSRGGAGRWDGPRLDAAVTSTDPKERTRLFSDLSKTLLPMAAKGTDRFVDIDEGLGALSRHAKDLGYDGVVLYLDELILWLASRSADMPFVQREINKLVKLKEAGDEDRPVPIVSFIARQRDLTALMGDAATGAERQRIEETIEHHKSRFQEIKLADSNLRAIIPHRVVKTRTPADRAELEEGFADMWRSARESAAALQGGDATEEDFRQVYPFSPALIDVLIGLSDQLQRDRTAIRILMELLVEHLPDLKLGEVVPVGDVYDIVASADDAVDGPARANFQRARDLYRHDILPWLQAKYGTDTAERCQRLRDGHPLRIGCSGCAVTDCRAHNRLAKTLLLSALVPKARPFRDLTIKRLVDLNHGTIQAPIPAIRVNRAATLLREMARDVHPIEVADGGDPSVRVSLQSIDLRPLLDRARDQDTRSRRRNLVRKMLFSALGVDALHSAGRHTVTVHHVRRTGVVTFGNVRELRPAEMDCPRDAQWHVVIDYPFDTEGYSPADDIRAVETARDTLKRDVASCVWLPTFFSQRVLDDLGDLAKLEHILMAENLAGFLAEVPPDDHQRARIDLESLRDRKRFEVSEAMKKAYGLLATGPDDPHIDPDRAAAQHVVSLHGGQDVRRLHEASLSAALDRLARGLVEARYPRHPAFGAVPSGARVGRVRDALERALDTPDHRIHVDSRLHDDIRDIGEPLHLCRAPKGGAVELLHRRFDELEGRLQQSTSDAPSVRDLASWMDPKGEMGLPEEVISLVAWLWGAHVRRVPMLGGRPVDWPPTGRLGADTVFEKPDLPEEAAWSGALTRAAVFGVNIGGKALSARSLADLCRKLRAVAVTPQAKAAGSTPASLRHRMQALGHSDSAARLTTADALAGLLEALEVRGDRALVEALAAASTEGTSANALGKAFAAASSVHRALLGQGWAVLDVLSYEQLEPDKLVKARAILDEVRKAVQADELIQPLGPRLNALVDAATALIKTKPPPPSGWSRRWRDGFHEVSAEDALTRLDALRRTLASQIEDGGPAPKRVNLTVELWAKDTIVDPAVR
jgi:hypothetical protein